MIAPCFPWSVIAREENTSEGGGSGSGVNDSSLLPLLYNSKVGEHLTGWGFGVWGE